MERCLFSLDKLMLVDSLPILRPTSFSSVLALPILPTYYPKGHPARSLFTKLITILKRSTFGSDSRSIGFRET